MCYDILCGNENQAEALKPTQRWLHHLLHPFWVTLFSSPRPHPPASASNQNGSKWWPPACRASPKTRSFRRRASSRLAENKRSLIHQMLHLPQPTLQSDAVIFTSPHVRLEGLSFFLSFFFYLLCFLGFIGAPDSHRSQFKSTKTPVKNKGLLLLFVMKYGEKKMCLITRNVIFWIRLIDSPSGYETFCQVQIKPVLSATFIHHSIVAWNR